MPTSLRARQADARLARGSLKRALRAMSCAALALAFIPSPAAADKVRITNISDVNFGMITNLQADARQSQNICVFSNSTAGAYSILASGSGTGSAFTLSNGSNSLAYEVQWADQSGQTSGTSLAPNVTATGRTSSASHQSCNTGPPTSASLVIILRASQLGQARAGNYSGSLTLLVAAE